MSWPSSFVPTERGIFKEEDTLKLSGSSIFSLKANLLQRVLRQEITKGVALRVLLFLISFYSFDSSLEPSSSFACMLSIWISGSLLEVCTVLQSQLVGLASESLSWGQVRFKPWFWFEFDKSDIEMSELLVSKNPFDWLVIGRNYWFV